MRGGEGSFAQALGRTACAQIIYAQAERLSTHRPLKTPARGPARPVAPANIFATDSVADALADVAHAFIEQLGRAVHNRAEHAGRTHSTLTDALSALNSMSCITNSTPRDLAKYAMFQEVPFPRPVPPFPVLPAVRKRPRDILVDEGPAPERGFIEPWMPDLPSTHTYVATPVYVNPSSKKKDSSEPSSQRRRVEISLAQLREAQDKGTRNDKQTLLTAVAAAVPDNPFLAPPKIGAGRIFDEDMSGEPRELVEPPPSRLPADALDTNAASVERPRNAISDQKRARADRILAEAGSCSAVTASNKPSSHA